MTDKGITLSSHYTLYHLCIGITLYHINMYKMTMNQSKIKKNTFKRCSYLRHIMMEFHKMKSVQISRTIGRMPT